MAITPQTIVGLMLLSALAGCTLMGPPEPVAGPENLPTERQSQVREQPADEEMLARSPMDMPDWYRSLLKRRSPMEAPALPPPRQAIRGYW